MTIYKTIFTRSPINKTAECVISQRNCSFTDTPLTVSELNDIKKLLERKSKLMKYVLKITSVRQHKNLMYAINKGSKRHQMNKEPRILREYVRLGKEIEKISLTIAEQKRLNTN